MGWLLPRKIEIAESPASIQIKISKIENEKFEPLINEFTTRHRQMAVSG